MQKGYYTITEVAQILGVNRGTIYEWQSKGKIKIETDYRNLPAVTAEELQRLQNERKN